jgi:hypothetical protein
VDGAALVGVALVTMVELLELIAYLCNLAQVVEGALQVLVLHVNALKNVYEHVLKKPTSLTLEVVSAAPWTVTKSLATGRLARSSLSGSRRMTRVCKACTSAIRASISVFLMHFDCDCSANFFLLKQCYKVDSSSS